MWKHMICFAYIYDWFFFFKDSLHETNSAGPNQSQWKEALALFSS